MPFMVALITWIPESCSVELMAVISGKVQELESSVGIAIEQGNQADDKINSLNENRLNKAGAIGQFFLIVSSMAFAFGDYASRISFLDMTRIKRKTNAITAQQLSTKATLALL